jgi:hypothetical protein
MSAKRVGVEALIIVILVLAGAGIWWWKDRELGTRLSAQEESCRAEVALVRKQAETWATRLAASEATAAFRAFAAGVQPAVLTGRRDNLDQAVTALLEVPGIDAVHVVNAQGEVLASSDRKLLTTGSIGERGAWVLATTDLTARPGDRLGVTQLAAPVVGAAGPAGYLWIGYRTGEVRDAARPPGFGPPAAEREQGAGTDGGGEGTLPASPAGQKAPASG